MNSGNYKGKIRMGTGGGEQKGSKPQKDTILLKSCVRMSMCVFIIFLTLLPTPTTQQTVFTVKKYS